MLNSSPTPCPHHDGKSLVTPQAMVEKIRAAVARAAIAISSSWLARMRELPKVWTVRLRGEGLR